MNLVRSHEIARHAADSGDLRYAYFLLARAVSSFLEGKMSLGLEINNPFDLRDEGIPWQGRIGSREGFVVFDTIVNGLRAGMKDLHTKYVHDGLTTTRTIVSKYAPPSENDTKAYIEGVCSRLGLTPDEDTHLDQVENLYAFGSAIIHAEQGSVPYDDQLLAAAATSVIYPDGEGEASAEFPSEV